MIIGDLAKKKPTFYTTQSGSIVRFFEPKNIDSKAAWKAKLEMMKSRKNENRTTPLIADLVLT